jgi:hypothetical protein
LTVLDRVTPTKPCSESGSCCPAQLERDPAVVAEIERLDLAALLEVPEVELAAVLAGRHIARVEAVLEGVRRAPLAGDERVLARLVPEVVGELELAGVLLPAARDREVARVERREAARAVAVGVAQHRDRDDVAGHAVDSVGGAEAELLGDLLALDHMLDPRRGGVGDIEHVDAAGPEAGDDQGVALEARVAGRGAGVPAEVMELVADVRHVDAADDLAVVLGGRVDVDHRDEVRLLDPGALI